MTPPPRKPGSGQGSVSSIRAVTEETSVIPFPARQLSNKNLSIEGRSYESVSISVSLKAPDKFGSANSVVRADGTLVTPPPRKNLWRGSVQGSTGSVNSFVDEKGVLVTPPPRKHGRCGSAQSSVSSFKPATGETKDVPFRTRQLSNPNLTGKGSSYDSASISVSDKAPEQFGSVNSVVREDGTLVAPPPRKSRSRLLLASRESIHKSAVAMDHIYNGSTVSLNRGLTAAAAKGDLNPLKTPLRKMSSNVSVPGSCQETKLGNPRVRATSIQIAFNFQHSNNKSWYEHVAAENFLTTYIL